jgi:Tol biopolymer transport system component
MTGDRFERQLPDVLTDLSLPSVPDYFDDLISQIARTPQRPGWTFPQRWLPMDFALQRPVGSRQIPWRTLGLLAVLAVLVAIAIVTVGSRKRTLPAPFGPASNGSIIYARDGDIYVADKDGRHEALLIGGATDDLAATWSRDGSTILFGRNVDDPGLGTTGTIVMAADPDGRNVRQLASARIGETDGLDVSPTGTKLALINIRPGGHNVLSVLDFGGEMRDLDLGSVEPMRGVTWRPPDGNELIFAGRPHGIRYGINPDITETDVALYAIGPDGSGLRQITLHHGESIPPKEDQISFQDLTISDDGGTAAYWTWEPRAVAGRTCSSYLVDLNTGRERRLLPDPSDACDVAPQFLPDDRILVRSDDISGMSQLRVAPIDGGAPGRAVGPRHSYLTESGWSISPDRGQILFVPTSGVSRLISIETGEARDTGLVIGDAPSWHRLAP